MSNSLEIIPVIPGAQQEVQWSPQVQEFFVRKVLAYHTQHAAVLPNFAGGGFEIAAEIVKQAFVDGILDQNTVPTTQRQVEESLRVGFEKRKLFLNQFRASIYDSKEETADLGINKKEQSDAEEEYFQRDIRADFPHINEFNRKVQERKTILPILSEYLLTETAQRTGIIDPAKAGSFLQDTASQAKIIRGGVVAALGNLWGIENINPAFITDSNIDDLIQYIDNDMIDDQLQSVVAALTQNIESDIDAAVIQDVFMDFGKQSIYSLLRWAMVKRNQNLTMASEEYWEYKNNMLKGLPTNAFTPDVQYGFTKESIDSVLQSGIHHLWEDTVSIDGFVVPTLESIENGLRLLLQAGYAVDHEHVVRLYTARNTFRSFYSTEQKIAATINMEEQKMASLHQYFQRNEFLGNIEIGEPKVIGRELKRLKLYMNVFNRANEVQTRTREILAEMRTLHESTSADDNVLEKINMIRRKNQEDAKTTFSFIRRYEEALHRESFRTLYNLDFEGDYTDPARVKRELDNVEIYIKELEEHPGQTLPVDLLKDPDKLSEFITNELGHMIRSRRKDIDVLERDAIVYKAVQLAKKKNFKWMGFRTLFLTVMESDRHVLRKMYSLQQKNDRINRTLSLVTLYEETDSIDPELQKIIESVSKTNLESYIQELEMIVLPDELLPSVLQEHVNDAKAFFQVYDRALRGVRIEFSEEETIEESINNAIAKETAGKNRQTYIGACASLLEIIHNPLFPVDLAKGNRASKLVNAYRKRIGYAEALLHENRYGADMEQLTHVFEIAKRRKEWTQNMGLWNESVATVNKKRGESQYQRANLLNTLDELELILTPHEFNKLSARSTTP